MLGYCVANGTLRVSPGMVAKNIGLHKFRKC